ncbi:unnamed protein product, partial [Mycena citricolor]
DHTCPAVSGCKLMFGANVPVWERWNLGRLVEGRERVADSPLRCLGALPSVLRCLQRCFVPARVQVLGLDLFPKGRQPVLHALLVHASKDIRSCEPGLPCVFGSQVGTVQTFQELAWDPLDYMCFLHLVEDVVEP